LVVVPPFLKYLSGPLLGPAILAEAGQAAGHDVTVLDLNIRWIREKVGYPDAGGTSAWLGDHDSPSAVLRAQLKAFGRQLAEHLPSEGATPLAEDPALTLMYDHEAVHRAAISLVGATLGAWTRGWLSRQESPDLVCVSVLYSGQVLAALVTSRIAKVLWPGVKVIWGGPHVTALRDEIVADVLYGRDVDGFVFGYAEGTFVEMLDSVARDEPLPAQVVTAGSREVLVGKQLEVCVPRFGAFELYGNGKLTIPVQMSRGCPCARCTYCTYPRNEGGYRVLGSRSVSPAVAIAERIGAVVSFKDSLLSPGLLREVAQDIGGRVLWSACTKLHRCFDADFLTALFDGGCRTLELGIETFAADGQQLIDKPQSVDLFRRVMDAAQEAGVALVVNYITGFPGVDESEDLFWVTWLHEQFELRPGLDAMLERNTFQLERLSLMGSEPDGYGLRVVEKWPWSSVLAWERV